MNEPTSPAKPEHKPTRVFLSFRYISKRRGGISDLSRTWVVAEWVTRGTGTVVYKSKQCGALKHADARAEAEKLAKAWLARQNERPARSANILASEEWPGPRFVDTTGEDATVE